MASTVTNTIPQAARKLGRESRRQLTKDMRALSTELEGRFKRKITEKQAIASGTLRSSVQTVFQRHGTQTTSLVGASADHASYAEFGTAPHWAPIRPLMEWVNEKRLDQVSRFISTGKTTRARGASREKAIRSIAYAVQRSIARKGTQAKFYMRDTLKEMGLTYRVVHSGSLGWSFYEISNLADYFAQKGFWMRVESRMS